MFAKTKELPSVVSTRILKTHRLNEVETFRLQGKIRTIDNEIHASYCQISDEIDGVRKNLNRIRKLKNNLGISVERRKLLREKGVFVIPSPAFADEGITLRRKDGKKVTIRGKECYDGEIIRRYLDMSLELSEINVEGDCGGEGTTTESLRGDDETHEKRHVLQYRIISPPLRPGSRRNFKNFEEGGQSDVDVDLPPSENYMNSLRKSPYRVRAQTAVTGRKETKARRISRTKSQTSQRRDSGESAMINLENNLSGEDVGSGGNIQPEHELEIQELRDDTEIPSRHQTKDINTESNDNNNKQRNISFKNSVHGQNQEGEPKPRKGKVRRNSSSTDPLEINPTISIDDGHLNKAAQKDSKNIRSAVCFLSQRIPVGHQRRQSLPTEPLKLLQKRRIDESVKFSSPSEDTLQENMVESFAFGRHECEANKNGEALSPRYVEPTNNRSTTPVKDHSRSPSKGQSTNQYERHLSANPQPKPRTESFNAIANSATKSGRKSTITNTSERKFSIANNDFIYDARPDKALSKGYTTMQMTIGGKQVQLCVPKFSNDDIVERIRATSAAKLADDRTRGHAPKQGENTVEKKTKKY